MAKANTVTSGPVVEDVDVEQHSTALVGRRILLGISGGIAATQSIKLVRELRRHGADLEVIMTQAAQQVITPLAVSWASGKEVFTDWEAGMNQLSGFDAVLICPATRHVLAAHRHGILSSPLLMAMSAARGRGVPILAVPSMHGDLEDDPVTDDLLTHLEQEGMTFVLGPWAEGRRKQADEVTIIASLCHTVRHRDAGRRRVVITLGANRAPFDAVRAIQNASSGRTGWAVACDLHRHGHDVTVVAGATSRDPEFTLPHVIRELTPEGMLSALHRIAHASPEPEVWIHAAAVLDYVPDVVERGKRKSGQQDWSLRLVKTPKHLAELHDVAQGRLRIGFKLEHEITEPELWERAEALRARYGLDAVVANLLTAREGGERRGWLVQDAAEPRPLDDLLELAGAIRGLVEGAPASE